MLHMMPEAALALYRVRCTGVLPNVRADHLHFFGNRRIGVMATRAATCSFCGLLCDDLEVEINSSTIKILRNGCERSQAAFKSLGTPLATQAQPRVRGKTVTFDAAIEAGARLLRASRRPLVSGLDIDVEGMRALLPLARQMGAVMDHANSAAKYRNLHVLQESGWITTTLSEARNRADVIVVVGDGWHKRYPRFVERIIAPKQTLFQEHLQRRVIALTPLDHDARIALPAAIERLELGATLDRLPILLSSLTAMSEGKPLAPDRLSGIPEAILRKCMSWLHAASYGVVVWSAADLEIPHAELAVQSLSRWIRILNQKVRFAGLPLAGTDADLTSNAVVTWQSGVSYPLSFSNRAVDFDPWRHAHERVLARGEADAVLWVSSLSGHPVTLPNGLPSVVLARADQSFATPPEVFIPVATPGIDAAGHLMRTDKVVSLHLPQLRRSQLRSVAETVASLSERLKLLQDHAH